MKTFPIYQSPKLEKNQNKYGNLSDSCVCCGKPTTQKLFIHATTDWVAIDERDDTKVPNSQGAFPIGADCAKRFPKEFIFKAEVVSDTKCLTPTTPKEDISVEMIIEYAKKVLQYPAGSKGYDPVDAMNLKDAIRRYEEAKTKTK